MELVIDHSVQVDVARSDDALQANMEFEFHRNRERFSFLKWGSSAFHDVLVVPHGSGIVHQVEIYVEYKATMSFILLLYWLLSTIFIEKMLCTNGLRNGHSIEFVGKSRIPWAGSFQH